MADSSALTSPPPGAPPTTSHTSASVQGPPATLPAVTTPEAASHSLKAQVSLHPLSPRADPFVPKGRSKEQRWTDASPSSSSGSASTQPSLSFKEALLSSSGTPSPPHPAAKQAAAPIKILLKNKPHPPRLVPVDLRGRCFNCFSRGHRAADCRKSPRCFKCRQLGHRSDWCPGVKVSSVWRRVTPSASEAGLPADFCSPVLLAEMALEPQVAAVPTSGGATEAPDKHRRRSVRKRRSSDHDKDDADNNPVPPANSGVEARGAVDAVPSRPWRIIDRSAKIARAKEELRNTLSVSLIGDPLAYPVDVLAVEIASRFELPAGSLEFHRLSPEDFLLVLPDEAAAIRVYNDGRPLQLPPISLHF
ncbi:hypothetical protein EJB05_51289, partial [Eragrostis curvula]